MAVKTLNVVAGNTAPPLDITCKRGSTVVDLTGCTVAVIIKSKVSGLITNTGHQTAVVLTPAASGVIAYARQTGDVPVKGTYLCDVKVTYSDTTFEILYDQLKLKARDPLS